MSKKVDFKERAGLVSINTKKWMRPKTACEVLEKRGIKVSSSLMNYWIINDKIDSVKVKSLDNLTLVNINTIPEEMRISTRIS